MIGTHQQRVIAIATVMQLCVAISGSKIFENFCDKALCRNGIPHVACNIVNGLQSLCPQNATEYELGIKDKEQILHLHNMFRSELARGIIPPFQTSSKMMRMEWDNTLAHVAGYNARSCIIGRDKCHATHEYPLAGQNVGAIDTNEHMTDIESVITKWSKAIGNNGNIAYIRYNWRYSADMMSQDRSAHVGCALVVFQKKVLTRYLVCNYEYGGKGGDKAYKTGSPCSECPPHTKCSNMYPGLCV